MEWLGENRLARLADVARELWPFEGALEEPRHSANLVFRTGVGPQSRLLRLGEARYRSDEFLHAELDWILFLKAQGLDVAAPLESKKGNWIETVHDGTTEWKACAFEYIEGTRLDESSLTEEFSTAWGRYISRMHRLSQKWRATPRAQWDSDANFIRATEGRRLETISGDDAWAQSTFDDCVTWMRDYPRTPHNFGLVHCDFHAGNFLLRAGKPLSLALFDFDDCCYHWFGFDLAAPIQSIRGLCEKRTDGSAIEAAFLRGYRSEHRSPPELFADFERFNLYRSLFVYFWIRERLHAKVYGAERRKAVTDFLPILISRAKASLEICKRR